MLALRLALPRPSRRRAHRVAAATRHLVVDQVRDRTAPPLAARASDQQRVSDQVRERKEQLLAAGASNQQIFEALTAALARKEQNNAHRCKRCWHDAPQRCICAQLPPVVTPALRFKVLVLMHPSEYLNPGDDAKLLLALLPPSHASLYIFGRPGDEDALRAELQRDPAHTLLLWPGEGSITVDELLSSLPADSAWRRDHPQADSGSSPSVIEQPPSDAVADGSEPEPEPERIWSPPPPLPPPVLRVRLYHHRLAYIHAYIHACIGCASTTAALHTYMHRLHACITCMHMQARICTHAYTCRRSSSTAATTGPPPCFVTSGSGCSPPRMEQGCRVQGCSPPCTTSRCARRAPSYMHMHTHTHMHTHVGPRTCMHVHTHTRTRMHALTHMQVHPQAPSVYHRAIPNYGKASAAQIGPHMHVLAYRGRTAGLHRGAVDAHTCIRMSSRAFTCLHIHTGAGGALRVCTVEAVALLLHQLGEPTASTSALIDAVRTHDHMYTCTLHACTHECKHTYMHTCMRGYSHAHMHAHMHAHACMHIHVHMHRCMHMHMHRCMHIHMHIHMHTHMHMHTCMQVRLNSEAVAAALRDAKSTAPHWFSRFRKNRAALKRKAGW